VYGNTSGNATYKNFYSTSDAGITYTCTTNPVVAGTGCITDNPLPVSPANSNYTLQAASPCLDKGTNQTWMTGALDLAGSNRLAMATITSLTAIVDLGAYEAQSALVTPNIGNLSATLVTTNSAQMNGWLVSTGKSPTAVYVLWGTAKGVTTPPWQNTMTGRRVSLVGR
jgi:hypothetical protein